MRFEPHQILVPTDYSDTANAALHFAETLANLFGSELTVLHAGSLQPAPEVLFAGGVNVMIARPEIVAEREKELEHYVSKHLPSLKLTRVFSEEPPAQAILSRARPEGMDLVVMGTHGRSGIRQFMVGSVAAEVLHKSRVPVVTLQQWSNFVIGRILCPVDDSWIARQSVRLAADFAKHLGAELLVLRLTDARGLAFPRTELPSGARVEEMEIRDKPGEQIAVFAKGAHANLIVIGSQHGHFKDSAVGTAPYDIVIRAECPVLTLNSLAAEVLLEKERLEGEEVMVG